MKKFLKIGLIVGGIGLVIGLCVLYWVFNKPHRNVEGEKPAFIMTATDLYSEYSTNEEASNTKYVNKVLQVTGPIAEITIGENEATIVLIDEMEGVSCAMDSLAAVEMKDKIKSLKQGDNITLKGKCDGYDMIMGVVLTKCFFVEDKK
jgi:hypothetical protein